MSFFDGAGEDEVFYRGLSDLDGLATTFIRRSYLQDLRSLPRMQDVPESGFLTGPKTPVFISYPWRGPNQPNDDILNAIRSFVPNQEGVGLWIDYCCLPQRRRDGIDDRTETERLFFKSQLQYIPTILLKSQMVVLWDELHRDRAWCVVEVLLADIFKNVIMKQIYHCKDRLADPLMFVTQTYNPVEYCLVGGVVGTPVVKILLPYGLKDECARFYNFVLRQLGMPPTLLTTLLGCVEREHIDRFFEDNELKCTNDSDLEVVKQLLLKVCRFAASYDVRTIQWDGQITCSQLLPYIFANTSDFTVSLVDYGFD